MKDEFGGVILVELKSKIYQWEKLMVNNIIQQKE